MKNMKWNKKYNYPKSSRSILNGSRHYNVSNQILPSVTSILSLTRSDSEKASLAAWAERVGKSESLRIKNTAAARGTEMHQKIEDFLLSRDNLNLFEEDEGDEKNKAKKMADLIIDEGLKPSLSEINGVECVCYYSGSNGFSGTSDLIGVFEGVESVIDFKQKNSIMKESYESLQTYFTQCGAYSLAHNKTYGSNITQGVILLATTDLVFQIFRVKGEKLIEYQNKFLERVEKYYSIVR
jgi:genome maintenance exonuclease 1